MGSEMCIRDSMEIEGESREAIEGVIRALSIDPKKVSTLSIRELQKLKNK